MESGTSKVERGHKRRWSRTASPTPAGLVEIAGQYELVMRTHRFLGQGGSVRLFCLPLEYLQPKLPSFCSQPCRSSALAAPPCPWLDSSPHLLEPMNPRQSPSCSMSHSSPENGIFARTGVSYNEPVWMMCNTSSRNRKSQHRRPHKRHS